MDEQAEFRQAIGLLIRRLRVERKLSGRQLGRTTAMSQSKISKIESGSLLLNEKDARALIAAFQLTTVAATNLLQRVRLAHRRVLATPTPPENLWDFLISDDGQHAFATEEKLCSVASFYSPFAVSALLQEPGYADAIIPPGFRVAREEGGDRQLVDRTHRQALLHDTTKQFRFLFTPASFLLFEPELALSDAQLGRLRYWQERPNVDIRLLPYGLRFEYFVSCTFTLYDDRVAFIEVPEMEIAVRDPTEVEKYSKRFEALWSIAASGGEAMRRISHLRKENPDNDLIIELRDAHPTH